MARASQALPVGDLERTNMNSGDADDRAEPPISEASSDDCECCTDVLRVCCARLSHVRGSANPWALESVPTGDCDTRLWGESL